MAIFLIAYDKTMKDEGGYAIDQADPGGETYSGVSRVFHPSWDGWPIIDQAKMRPGFPVSLKAIPELKGRLQSFYKAEFWDKFAGDRIPDQSIANELFDQSVNMKSTRVFEHLQIALNVLNDSGRLYPDLVVDGYFGPRTLAMLITAIGKRGARLIFNLLNIQQGAYYIQRMRERPDQEKYVGWFERVEVVK